MYRQYEKCIDSSEKCIDSSENNTDKLEKILRQGREYLDKVRIIWTV
jgi:hypothetical protein